MTNAPFTDDQLAAAGGQVQPPPLGTGPDADQLADKAAAGSATEVDVRALLAQMQAQQEALAAEVARLRGSQAPQGEHPLSPPRPPRVTSSRSTSTAAAKAMRPRSGG